MKNAIEVRNLKKSFYNYQVLKDVNISVKHGEKFGLLGANRGGKGTLIDCILRTKKVNSGIVSLLGIKLLKLSTLGLPIDNMLFPLIFMLLIFAVCTIISVKFFKWE